MNKLTRIQAATSNKMSDIFPSLIWEDCPLCGESEVFWHKGASPKYLEIILNNPICYGHKCKLKR